MRKLSFLCTCHMSVLCYCLMTHLCVKYSTRIPWASDFFSRLDLLRKMTQAQQDNVVTAVGTTVCWHQENTFQGRTNIGLLEKS